MPLPLLLFLMLLGLLSADCHSSMLLPGRGKWV
jgi:hypothetical protein